MDYRGLPEITRGLLGLQAGTTGLLYIVPMKFQQNETDNMLYANKHLGKDRLPEHLVFLFRKLDVG